MISSPDTRVTPTRDQSNKFSQLPRVIEPDPVDPKFGIDKEENNVAKEYKDDPEDTNIEDDEDGLKRTRLLDGGGVGGVDIVAFVLRGVGSF